MKKIAVCSQNRRGVTGYAARCRNFMMFVVQTERKRIISREPYSLYKEETFFMTEDDKAHPLDEVDVLISGGMGSGLQQSLAKREITGLVTNEIDPTKAVKLYLKGLLPLVEIEDFHDSDEYIEDLSKLPPEIRNKCCGNTDSSGGCCGKGLKGLV